MVPSFWQILHSGRLMKKFPAAWQSRWNEMEHSLKMFVTFKSRSQQENTSENTHEPAFLSMLPMSLRGFDFWLGMVAQCYRVQMKIEKCNLHRSLILCFARTTQRPRSTRRATPKGFGVGTFAWRTGTGEGPITRFAKIAFATGDV